MSVTRIPTHLVARRAGLLAVVMVCSVALAAPHSTASDPGTRVIQNGTDVFRVQFPAAAQQTSGIGKSAAQEQHQFTLKDPNGVYMLVYQDYPKLDFADPSVAKSALDVARDGFKNALSAELIREQPVRFPGSGATGTEFELKIPRLNGQSRSRSVAVGHRWYSVTVLGTPEFVQSPAATQFLKSATLVQENADSTPPTNSRNTRLQNIIKRLGD